MTALNWYMSKTLTLGVSMKTVIGILVVAFSMNTFASELSKEAKAISASKALYSMNLGAVKDVKFSASKAKCDGDETVETCEIEVSLVEKNPTPGGISYTATFMNNQLSGVEQNCKYCW